MRKSIRRALTAAATGLVVYAGAVAAAEPTLDYFDEVYPAPSNRYDETVRLRASIGVLTLEANEYVFLGNYTVSQLIWRTQAPVLRGSISADIGAGFSVSAEGSMAAMGVSGMEDYDWLGGDDTFENWTHRSQHADTRLNHYWTGAAMLGYDLANVADATIRLHGGLKYTDVKWTAHGGNYVYSVGGFRDTSGSFANGAPVIAYQQQIPEVFLGVDGDQYYGERLRVGGLLRGGMTVMAVATDDHFLRNLRFIDTLQIAPTFTAALDLGFRLTKFAEITVAARYDKIFMGRGETRTYNTTTGSLVATTPDSGAADLGSAELTAGLRANF